MDDSNWQALVELARAGNVAPLVEAYQQYGQHIRRCESRALTWADLPDCLVAYLEEVLTPKKRGRGRPRFTEWERETTRRDYETNRLLAELTKRHAGPGSGEIIEGRVYPISEKPSDYALRVTAESIGIKDAAVRDRVYPRRKKRNSPAE